jgi:hypothetical protein
MGIVTVCYRNKFNNTIQLTNYIFTFVSNMADQLIIQALKVTDPSGKNSNIVDISLRDFYLSQNMILPERLQWKTEIVNADSQTLKEVGKGKVHEEPQSSYTPPEPLGDATFGQSVLLNSLQSQLAEALSEINNLKAKISKKKTKPTA